MKKLYKDDNDPQFLGDSQGLGEYFEIDPVIIRVVFLIMTFLDLYGLALYFMFAISMPKKSVIKFENENENENEK